MLTSVCPLLGTVGSIMSLTNAMEGRGSGLGPSCTRRVRLNSCWLGSSAVLLSSSPRPPPSPPGRRPLASHQQQLSHNEPVGASSVGQHPTTYQPTNLPRYRQSSTSMGLRISECCYIGSFAAHSCSCVRYSASRFRTISSGLQTCLVP